MATLDDLLSLREVHGAVILDGAFGTEISARGLPPGCAPEIWNITHPDKVSDIARAYAEAGAHIVLTNSFGGSRYKLDKTDNAHTVIDINAAAARNAREGAGERAYVFGSVGPTGEFLAPLGMVTEDDVTAVFIEQIEGLVAGGVDGIVVETMTDLGEAVCALRAAKQVAPHALVVVSMTFDKGVRGYATMMGVTPAAAAQRLTDEGADIIGTNCGNGMENVCDIIALLAAETSLPLWAKPNAGMPILRDGVTVFPAPPEEMAAQTPTVLAAGAICLGGCCGTTPTHIRAMAAAAAATRPA